MRLSEPLSAFLRKRLTSAEQIDIVVLLMRDRRAWAASEVAQALDMAPEATAMRLFLLASAGFIAFEAAGMPRYQYVGAGDSETDRLLHELAEVHANDRAAILEVVDAPPPDPVRSFADAFRLKR